MNLLRHIQIRYRRPAVGSRLSPALLGFTMIEILIVIGIMALILTIGIPSMFKIIKKDPMRQAVSDIVEACSHARAQAIMNGAPAEVRFRPREGLIAVAASSQPASVEPGLSLVARTDDLESRPAATAAKPFTARLSEDLVIELLDVNFHELKDEEEARVRFFPNGTCEEFTIVLQWPEYQMYRKITLDIITGQADVEVIR